MHNKMRGQLNRDNGLHDEIRHYGFAASCKSPSTGT